MENEQEPFEEGKVLIKIVQKMQEGRAGVDVIFDVETMDTGTLMDLGTYFTTLGRGQRVRTQPLPDEKNPDVEANGQKKGRPRKPKPVRN